jgi:hypothetical protein
MNIRKLLILLWSVLATVSCLIDYVNYSYIEFVNKSSVGVKFINKEGRDHYRSYRYTFTDEDYQYALENGQKVNQ